MLTMLHCIKTTPQKRFKNYFAEDKTTIIGKSIY